jgi:tRNA modification GTPase
MKLFGNMNFYDDTIVAPATVPGTGAISVIRLSGPDAFSIADKVVRLRKGKVSDAVANTVHYGAIPDLDDVMVAIYKAPHSYTGEDSVEVSCHASKYIVETALQLFMKSGARMAEPGEFTRRAFTAGKMDLAQAESVADLIASTTASAHKIALSQLRGGYSKELRDLRARLLEATSLMELELDFSEEDVEFADRKKLSTLVAEVLSKVSSLADSFRLGNAIRNGVPVAIAGQPNVGKSTLLNAILGDDRAIVTDIPGTTRDTIEETLNIDGILFRFIDTAGIRESEDPVEKAGIQRTFRKIDEAEIVLGMIDPTADDPVRQAREISSRVKGTLVLLVNKKDMVPSENIVKILGGDGMEAMAISALDPSDVAMVKKKLSDIMKSRIGEGDQTLVTNLRHFQALSQAKEALLRVQEGLAGGRTTDLVAQDLRDAITAIGTITGMDISEEEVLGNIFSHFCIGK